MDLEREVECRCVCIRRLRLNFLQNKSRVKRLDEVTVASSLSSFKGLTS